MVEKEIIQRKHFQILKNRWRPEYDRLNLSPEELEILLRKATYPIKPPYKLLGFNVNIIK